MGKDVEGVLAFIRVARLLLQCMNEKKEECTSNYIVLYIYIYIPYQTNVFVVAKLAS